MKLITTLETIKSLKKREVYVTVCLVDGFEIDDEDYDVQDAVKEYVEKILGYREYEKGEYDGPQYFDIEYSCNHIQGCWEITIITNDRFYFHLRDLEQEENIKL